MKTVLKSSLASGLFPTLPQLPDSGVPPFTLQTLRECMTTSLPLLFTGNSRLACFQISDSTIIHLPFSLSLSPCLSLSESFSVCLPPSLPAENWGSCGCPLYWLFYGIFWNLWFVWCVCVSFLCVCICLSLGKEILPKCVPQAWLFFMGVLKRRTKLQSPSSSKQ